MEQKDMEAQEMAPLAQAAPGVSYATPAASSVSCTSGTSPITVNQYIKNKQSKHDDIKIKLKRIENNINLAQKKRTIINKQNYQE